MVLAGRDDNTTSSSPSSSSSGALSYRHVDKGPSPEEGERSRDFLALWGQQPSSSSSSQSSLDTSVYLGGLAELRRFVDGGVQYAVAWTDQRLGGRAHARHAIVPLIVSSMLSRHIGAKMPSSILHSGDALVVDLVRPVNGTAGGGGGGGGPSSTLTQSERKESQLTASRALLYHDIARACPSLAVERALDSGGMFASAVRLTAPLLPDPSSTTLTTAAAATTTTSIVSEVSPLTGLPMMLHSHPSLRLPLHPTAVILPSKAAQLVAAGSSQGEMRKPVEDSLSSGPAGATLNAISVFEWLSGELRTAKGMPMAVIDVRPTAPQLRFTSMLPPCPHPLASGSGQVKNKNNRGGGDEEEEKTDALSSLLTSQVAARAALSLRSPSELIRNATVASESLHELHMTLRSMGATTMNVVSSITKEGSMQQKDSVHDDDNDEIDEDLRPSSSGPTATQTLMPLEAVLILARNSKWPDDLQALAALKTAFLLKLQYALQATAHNHHHRGNLSARASASHLDVLVGGYAFRLYLHVPRELKLLKIMANRDPLVPTPPSILSKKGNSEDDNRNNDDDNEQGAVDGGSPVVRGFVNVGKSREGSNTEGSPKKRARKAIAKATGFDVAEPISAQEMKKKFNQVFASTSSSSSSSMMQKQKRSSKVEDVDDYNIDEEEEEEARRAAGHHLDALYLREVARPSHAAKMRALAQIYPSFAPSVRLCSMWLSKQQIGTEPGFLTCSGAGGRDSTYSQSTLNAQVEGVTSGSTSGQHICHEAVELLVASLFISPFPHTQEPGSASTALLRFLRLLGRWNWVAKPLFVDVERAIAGGDDIEDDGKGDQQTILKRKHDDNDNEEEEDEKEEDIIGEPRVASSTSSDARTLASRFHSARHASARSTRQNNDDDVDDDRIRNRSPSGPALFIVTQADRGAWRPLWTSTSPSWSVLGRLVKLARSAETQLTFLLSMVIPSTRSNSSSSSSSSSATASSFRLLRSICVSFPMYADKSQLQLQLFSNLIARSRKALLVGFDPLACYLRSLRSVNVENGRMASFFVDTMRPEAGIGARIELEKVNNSEGVTTTGGGRSGISSQSVSKFAIVCAKEGAGFVKGVTLSRK